MNQTSCLAAGSQRSTTHCKRQRSVLEKHPCLRDFGVIDVEGLQEFHLLCELQNHLASSQLENKDNGRYFQGCCED